MKTLKHTLYLMSLLGLLFLLACSNDNYEIWDIAPAGVSISVVDKDNNNLLDPETKNNLLDNKIVATHKGQKYTIQKTKAIAPQPLGLRLYDPWTGDTSRLTFGEFWIEKKYRKETLVIDWGNGRVDTIEFAFQLKWYKKEPNVRRFIWLNGQKIDSDKLSVTIVMTDEQIQKKEM